MFLMTNLIEPRMEKLIINHLIGNNCPEFRHGFLDLVLFQTDSRKWLLETLFLDNCTYSRVSYGIFSPPSLPFPPPSTKHTLTYWEGLSNKEVSLIGSPRRARRSGATTFEQKRKILLRVKAKDLIHSRKI